MKRKYQWWVEWERLCRENPPAPPEIKALAAVMTEAMAVWTKHVKAFNQAILDDASKRAKALDL